MPGKQGKWPCHGKHREFGNLDKTQGILFGQVVNSFILKIQDTCIAIFAEIFQKSVLLLKWPQISELDAGKISSWTGKKTGKTGNLYRI